MAEDSGNTKDAGRVPWLVDKLVNVGVNLILTATFSVAATLAAVQTGLVDLGQEVIPDMRKEIDHRLSEIDKAINRLNTVTDLGSLEENVATNGRSITTLDNSVRNLTHRLDASVKSVTDLRDRLDNSTTDIRSYVETRTDRLHHVLEGRLDRLKDKQTDHRDAVMDALRDLSDEQQSDRRAMERLFDHLVASGERAIEAGDPNNVLLWMDQALYVITSLDIFEQDGFFVDRSIAKTALARAIARFRNHRDMDKGREDVETVMSIVRAVRELARTGRV